MNGAHATKDENGGTWNVKAWNVKAWNVLCIASYASRITFYVTP